MDNIECVFFEADQIRSLFYMCAAVGSGRSAKDMLDASKKGEVIDIDYNRITHARFYAVLALIATEHALQFDKTKSECKAMFNNSIDTAFAAVVQEH